MEQHVRKQQANIAEEEAQSAEEVDAKESNQKPESEKLPPTEQANIRSMADIVNAIKEGDNDIEQALIQFAKKINDISATFTDVQSRIANIETILEQLQLTNISIFDKLAKIAMSLVAFVAKFGTKKDADQTKDEVEADEVEADEDKKE